MPFKLCSYILAVLTLVAMLSGFIAAQTATLIIGIPEDRNAIEFVGQFNNTATTSQQFGYLSRIRVLNPIFSGTPNDETTALLTFVTDATTDRVLADGLLRIINRTGKTTIYLNTPPSDFSDPASFSQGTPIQVSTYRQQVILNTATNSFTTVHMNTIIETKAFSLNGQMYRLGRLGKSFRTTYSGQANSVVGTTPSGWFAGYAVGVK